MRDKRSKIVREFDEYFQKNQKKIEQFFSTLFSNIQNSFYHLSSEFEQNALCATNDHEQRDRSLKSRQKKNVFAEFYMKIFYSCFAKTFCVATYSFV